jgi:hypothetical protein
VRLIKDNDAKISQNGAPTFRLLQLGHYTKMESEVAWVD